MSQDEKRTALKCGTFGASSLQQRYLATGDFDGKMMIWYVADNYVITELQIHNSWNHHPFCMFFTLKPVYLDFLDQLYIVTVFFRNLENTERPVYSVKAHSQIVNAIDGVGGLGIGEGAPEIVTGSRDGESLITINRIKLL